ncbi:tRNA preQ1(34) S-adenosylmethionine ribosyltransferase-isomerase QueA [Thermosulfurimonas sp. F29]|uniref:tRNA preQ1(34) S-adenosylmethionine ribosyltransferase-isomerase QueA n=1 Tax=Thermosulfurimonas sp. F29 TaxID=2867247 RepID=UPI001C837562|nr:tRNA preQ1(34) S-adenosylmethionine ribosyltransferase-isomerase QueA [Thermosulfurimonas sp. F29]MBX6423879.1 tRNA preQ1(34) S-adenosylmethionine ribosyltransferase-isomerase QueA [Thermosulfurimonas sp. F29]
MKPSPNTIAEPSNATFSEDLPEDFRLEAYHYELPEELIAYHPPERREESRLLVLHRDSGRMEHRKRFSEIEEYLRAGDLLVLNDTRVFPARLTGRKETGGRVEILLLELPESGKPVPALYRGKKLLPGYRVIFSEELSARVLAKTPEGKLELLLEGPEDLLSAIKRVGKAPLPPYIKREPRESDLSRYQTVYARRDGSVAAPTAGFHFSEGLLERLREKGVQLAFLTLHVGYGTFAPVKTRDIRRHRLHREYVEIPGETVRAVEETHRRGGRVVAVGTTTVRALEWGALSGRLEPRKGWCDLYIYPGFRFRVVQAMITNFHLPGSSLLILVSAFAGREPVLKAYREAVKLRYRFFSYGDAMLIL